VDAVLYYAEHFDKVKAVLDHLTEEDAASIAAAKVQFRKPGISEPVAYKKTCFGQLLSVILQLEDTKVSIIDSIAIVRRVQSDLWKAIGDGAYIPRCKHSK